MWKEESKILSLTWPTATSGFKKSTFVYGLKGLKDLRRITNGIVRDKPRLNGNLSKDHGLMAFKNKPPFSDSSAARIGRI